MTDTSDANGEVLPDTPVEPVTLERVAEIFDIQGLEYRLEDQAVGEGQTTRLLRSGFSNTAIAMQLTDTVLTIDSVWRGSLPVSEGPGLLTVINEWNSGYFAPTLRFFEGPDNTLAVSGMRQLNVAEGASRNQLGAFVMSTLEGIMQSFTWIEKHYPQLVTWEEPRND